MADVFEYNSGSLFQAIAPESNLLPSPTSPGSPTSTTPSRCRQRRRQVYGSPWGSITGGGVFYNIPLYEKLGLEVPTPGTSS